MDPRGFAVTSSAAALADWAYELTPDDDDLALAQRSLVDTVAVTLAARTHPTATIAAGLGEAARWAAIGHLLDFDDLHMESTTHISAVCLSAALASGGGARAYLAAAGVMARLGNALGWAHYSAGWHATCTAGAPAAAVGAAVAMGLDPRQIATAIVLAVPGAGGVQRAFGTDAKSLQVGFAVDAGVRAARLAAAGAHADPSALDVWLELVGGSPASLDVSGPAVPGGLATKIYPCCYALQRPISALAALAADGLRAADVDRIVLRTPAATVVPLIHHRPVTGLQGKFSLEYAAATALLDTYPGFDSFTDVAVQRPSARELIERVDTELSPGGNWLLDGELEVDVHTKAGDVIRSRQKYPPGSPESPATQAQLAVKAAECLQGLDIDSGSWNWENAADVLRAQL
jgi:2-methylcitrate dehydratase PrpD